MSMDIQMETFAVPSVRLVDGLASAESAFPVSSLSSAELSTTSNSSAQTTGLLLGLLLLLIGCLA